MTHVINEEVSRMKKMVVYGTAVLALSAAPLFAQAGGSSTPPRTGGTTDQGSGGQRSGSQGGTTATSGGSQTGSQSGSQTGSQTSSRASGQSADAKNNSADHHFVMEAAVGGMAEVELGKLASEKASSDQVKQFGQRMVTDHSKANDELKTLAQSKNIMLPADLDGKHKATRDRLAKMSGDAFDRAYMQEMLEDHRKDVNEFRKESQSGKDPEVKAWAAKTLPTLEEHLTMVQSSRGAVGTSGSKSSGSGATGSSGRTSGSGSGAGAASGAGAGSGTGTGTGTGAGGGSNGTGSTPGSTP